MTFRGYFARSTPDPLPSIPAPRAPDLDANLAAHWRD